jgi:hypothetical protein
MTTPHICTRRSGSKLLMRKKEKCASNTMDRSPSSEPNSRSVDDEILRQF